MSYGHGKVILFGEHSVVHGRPALALAVARGAKVTAKPVSDGPTTLHIAPWNVDVDTGDEPNFGAERLQEALNVARAMYNDEIEVALHADMTLPGGAGMGSSAALGVAVLRAMDEARNIKRKDDELYERSLAWERVFHGTPSGIDNAAATHGGMFVFTKGSPRVPVVPRHRVRLLVGNSGAMRGAKEMVASVGRQFEKEPERVGKLFDAITSLVKNGKVAVEQGDLNGLGQLMTMNQHLLSSLLLSTDVLEEMIAASLAAGALGAKVTGAGGGGCMIALVDSDETHAKVKAALEALGKTVYEVESEP